MQTINRNDVPVLGQLLGEETLIARYWRGDQEIALFALPASAEFEGKWGEYGQNVDTNHGDGEANTKAMAEAGSPIAAKALELSTHIPSAFEGHAMMVAKQTGYLADLREDRFYWTSSQYSAYNAFGMGFEGGWQVSLVKFIERLVRPVRSRIIQ